MTAAEATRVLGLVSQVEMALVRRDAAAAALLAQAARAGDGLSVSGYLAEATRIARSTDLAEHHDVRKLVQALVRVAAQEAQAALLA